MRFRAALGWVAVIAGWSGGLVLLAMAGSGDAVPYALGGTALTIAVGALVNRYWLLWVPWIILGVALVVLAVWSLLPGGDSRYEADGLGLLFLMGSLTFSIPATVALLVGVLGRRAGAAVARASRASPASG